MSFIPLSHKIIMFSATAKLKRKFSSGAAKPRFLSSSTETIALPSSSLTLERDLQMKFNHSSHSHLE